MSRRRYRSVYVRTTVRIGIAAVWFLAVGVIADIKPLLWAGMMWAVIFGFRQAELVWRDLGEDWTQSRREMEGRE